MNKLTEKQKKFICDLKKAERKSFQILNAVRIRLTEKN